jgi:hypothetical protein
VNENAPITVSERMRTVAKTGRLTHSAASHCMITAPSFRRRAGRRSCSRRARRISDLW